MSTVDGETGETFMAKTDSATAVSMRTRVEWIVVPIVIAAIEAYRRAFKARDRVGRWSFWGLIGLTTAIWISGPWSPPPPSASAIAVVGLAMWLLPLWALWIERHR